MADASLILFGAAAGCYVCAAACLAAFAARPLPARRAAGRRLLRVGVLAHTLALAADVVRSGDIPLDTVFQSFVFLLWCIALAGLVVDWAQNQPMVSAFLLPLLAVLSLAAVGFVDDRAALPPRLSRWWRAAHAAPIFAAFALFACAFAASAMYLLVQRRLKSRRGLGWVERMPSLEVLDAISGRAVRWGFALFTVGLTAGLIWYKTGQRLPSPLGKDLKIWGGSLTWLAYAVVLHLRVRARRHGRGVAWLTVWSFFLVLATFVGAFWQGGRHAFEIRRAAPSGAQSPPHAVEHRT